MIFLLSLLRASEIPTLPVDLIQVQTTPDYYLGLSRDLNPQKRSYSYQRFEDEGSVVSFRFSAAIPGNTRELTYPPFGEEHFAFAPSLG